MVVSWLIPGILARIAPFRANVKSRFDALQFGSLIWSISFAICVNQRLKIACAEPTDAIPAVFVQLLDL